MTDKPRVRYQVRVRHVVAGTFLVASSAVSITGLSPTPAVAAGASSSVEVSYEASAGAERLAGVRSELDDAVAFGSVTTAQADAFYAQIERRVHAGL
ncbi:hypothetical protein IWX64_000206 [Arthrobacter sp. CAN_A212]|uniref:hypothetical protein n=1 Tax=unclassified Arthrobacter TaxID=235627 RepID=UPI0018CBD5A9|nr:hypothetical protein [Arthrobacter sp. CAN_C5]MBP2215616.1 hypothetical protein [Arthrobacter sp. CAN_C5]